MAYPSFVLMSSVVYELRVRSVSKETYREPARRGCIINKENSSLNTNKDFFLYPQLVQISQVVACAKVTIYIYISSYYWSSKISHRVKAWQSIRPRFSKSWNPPLKLLLLKGCVKIPLSHLISSTSEYTHKLDVVKCRLTNCLCTECGIHSFLLVKLAVRIWI